MGRSRCEAGRRNCGAFKFVLQQLILIDFRNSPSLDLIATILILRQYRPELHLLAGCLRLFVSCVLGSAEGENRC